MQPVLGGVFAACPRGAPLDTLSRTTQRHVAESVQDPRILPKLHRRVYLDRVTKDEVTLYISFYIEAANRDAFMMTKQEVLLAFAEACARHGAALASNRRHVRSSLVSCGQAYLVCHGHLDRARCKLRASSAKSVASTCHHC